MVVIVMGVSGCGKTTVGKGLAERLGWVFLDADAYHSAENVAKMSRGVPLTEADRKTWLEALRAQIAEQLDRGESAVLACSALTEAARQILRVDAERVRFVHLEGSYELIRRRMQVREDHFMPAGLLDSQFATLEPPTDAVAVSIDAPPDAIVERIVERLPKSGDAHD